MIMNFRKIFKLANEWENKGPTTERMDEPPTTERMDEAPTTDPLPIDLPPESTQEKPNIGFEGQAGDMAYLYKYIIRCIENDKRYGVQIEHENNIQDILDLISVQLSTKNTNQLMNQISGLQQSAKKLSPEMRGQMLPEINNKMIKLREQLNAINVYMPYTANELTALREYIEKCIRMDIKKLTHCDAATKEHRKAHITRIEKIKNKLPRPTRRHR
jgi:hypothetical protein